MGLVPFETDILILTHSGYATGFEIKVSKSDLLADLKKKQYARFNDNPYKQELYYAKTFKYFYYAVPKDLEESALSIIPEFVGLYVYEVFEHKIPTFKCVKEAKKLKTVSWSEIKINEVKRLGCMRIGSLKSSLSQQMKLTNYYKEKLKELMSTEKQSN
jgi:hypothetical protein